ncbi:TIGR03619 family F420-dependent LLM class oxidoreductase [Streptomyces sp. TG1A-8]|nr:TIGR03619 family F420-dependent LLM class oxidoreductase [Streptomyces sp. TG1A-8]MDO0924118.1 TIGR03619 family F420-dependent LLM class oxidoreductase [Streptomyces sp. TG1A-8]
MKTGFALPQFHKQAFQISQIADFAREAERFGAASLWVSDRYLAAVHPKVGYGGRGTTIPPELNAAADPLVLLGAVAAVTERVELGTHVLLAPLYPPVQLARALTTVDLISGRRLLPGFGIGWSPEEYEAAGLDFHRRGARMEELLDALEIIWTSDPAQYTGTHITVPLHHAPLKPQCHPRPPVYLGALSERALRRVAQRADGWLPLCVVPSYVDIDGLIAQRKLIDRLAIETGRDPSAIDTVLRVNADAGTPASAVADVIRNVHERTGIDHFLVDSLYVAETPGQSLDYAGDVLTLVGRG